MKKEAWEKNNQILIVGYNEVCEWRYEYRNGTYWISGLSLFELISNGWKRIL